MAVNKDPNGKKIESEYTISTKNSDLKKYKLLIIIALITVVAVAVVVGINIFNKPNALPIEESHKGQPQEDIQATFNTSDDTLIDSTAPSEDSTYTDDTSSDTGSRLDTEIFDKLYKGQPRSEIHNIFGTPDKSNTDSLTSSESDCYFDYEFLGKKGELYINYSDNLVTGAQYNYSYSSSEPSEEERNEVNEYALSIIKYYTEICGEPESTIYDYEWSFPNDYAVRMNYDPNETDFMCIYIRWGFEPLTTATLIC